MAQQYGYGYGTYPAYGYGQQAQAAVGYMQYGQRMGYVAPQQVGYGAYTPTPQATSPAAKAPPAQVATRQQQSVGYQTYYGQTSAATSSTQASTQQPVAAMATAQAPQQPSYYGYQTYQSTPPTYTPYYQQQQPSVATPTAQQSHTPQMPSVGYQPTQQTQKPQQTTPTSSISYPPQNANTYYYKQQQKPHTYPPYTPSVPATSSNTSYPPPPPLSRPIFTAPYSSSSSSSSSAYSYTSAPSAGGSWTQSSSYSYSSAPSASGSWPQSSSSSSSTTTTTSSSLTPHHQRLVQSYVQSKQAGESMQDYAARKRTSYQSPAASPALYYCEVCKISCVSALTYKTHLEGKWHKKKVDQPRTPYSPEDHYCTLCEVLCVSPDTFEAHMRGSKHSKTVTLHRKLGLPIPDPHIPASSTYKKTSTGKDAARIAFVGGTTLHSTGTPQEAGTARTLYNPGVSTPQRKSVTAEGSSSAAEGSGATQLDPTTGVPVDDEPTVGEGLVMPVKNDPRFPHASYKCTMCDCYFNDAYARRAHIKGRRHRLNFKKMYDPSLHVELSKQQKAQLEKRKNHIAMKRAEGAMANGGTSEGGEGGAGGTGEGGEPAPAQDPASKKPFQQRPAAYLRKPHGPPPPLLEEQGMGGYRDERYQHEDHEDYYPPAPFYSDWEEPPPSFYSQPPFQLHDPRDDRLVLKKHSAIYPLEPEVTAIEGVVSDTEKALKLVSDELLEQRCTGSAPKDESQRELKGIMRVGAFGLNLLLKGECCVELVLMCENKPTASMFSVVADRLPAKFQLLSDQKETQNVYNVTPEEQKAALIIISQVGDYCVQVTVTLTCVLMRAPPSAEELLSEEEVVVLDRPSCAAALAALRHTKWFQSMALELPSCTITIRVLKDICRRVPAWGVLDAWMLILLVQKCIISANPDYTKPGDVFRRVMECVASGIFLPGGSGLLDPCEKGRVDASSSLTAQDRANITLSAQHALRLIAFEKLHLVLGVEPLPPPRAPGLPRPKRPAERIADPIQDKEGAGDSKEDEETVAKKLKLDIETQ